ncbi:hypothetical protein ACET3X_001908 [Alternaria dauci]|uniref:Uncharacterized protein n=1 Tax=Alternaria dauci TaxID=48095 RepID=A0ABR3UYM6_9PLEO
MRPSAKRRRASYSTFVRSDAELNRRLDLALPVGWDGLIIDQYPDEETEAIYLIKDSNTRHERALTEEEIDRFEPGDLVLATVHEPTTDPNGRVGDDDITATIFGQAVSKSRFHILLEKHPKHGIFAPIGSRGSKGLQGLSKMEQLCRVGFRKADEHFDRDRLTENDPEFLSLHDPVELKQGFMDPWSFLDLSYLNEKAATKSVGQDVSLRSAAFDELAGIGDYDEPTFDKPTSDDPDDPDRPKGTAEEQKEAYSRRNMKVASALRDQVKTEKKLFQDVDDATLFAAQAEIHARRTLIDYQDLIATGTTGEHVLELCKNAAEQAVLDRDVKREKRDRLTASVDEVLAHPELRPRVPAGTEIDGQRLTIINDATKSLQDRLQSIARQY